jgi:hypothetical protein
MDFICCFAKESNPLFIFLDDIHWADSASLNLIEKLYTSHNSHNLAIVAAYRMNEMPSNLSSMISNLKRHIQTEEYPYMNLCTCFLFDLSLVLWRFRICSYNLWICVILTNSLLLPFIDHWYADILSLKKYVLKIE